MKREVSFIRLFILFVLFPFFISNPQNLNISNSFPELSKLIDKNELKADHIFVLDRSGSMKSYWPTVTSAIINLVKILPDGDYVSVLGFDSKCRPIITPRTLNAESRKLLLKEIQKLGLPKGKKTDLYAAVDKTLDELTRENSNSIKFVYFITDLKNEPPQNSLYRGREVYNNLKTKAEQVINNLNFKLILYALQVPLSSNAGQDYSRISELLHGHVERVILNKNSLAHWFVNQSKELIVKKYRAIILTYLASQLKLEDFSANSSNIFLTIKNPYPFDVKILNVNIFNEQDGKISQQYEKIIKSNEKEEFSFDAFKSFEKEKSILRVEKTKVADLSIEFLLLPKKEFEKLNIPPLQTNKFSNQKLFFTSGIPLYLFIAAGILIFIALYFLFIPCLKPLKTFENKTVKVAILLNGKMLRLKQDKFAPVKGEIILDNSLIQSSLHDTVPNFRIMIKTVKPSFPFCRSPKRGTYILNAGTLNFNQKKTTGGYGHSSLLSNDIKSSEPVNILSPIILEAHNMSGGKMQTLQIRISL